MSIMFVAMMADLLDMATATAWMEHGRCAETDPEAFFADEDETETAKAICAGCPVREDCLAYALAEDLRWGVWGGLTASERLPDQDLAA
jgi:WhiB family redox-sensing transcriptional regulator